MEDIDDNEVVSRCQNLAVGESRLFTRTGTEDQLFADQKRLATLLGSSFLVVAGKDKYGLYLTIYKR
jgi:hypothetical protein